MDGKKEYTIDQLARIASVSVRTLRHYDDINLLKPVGRNSADHRVYGESELLKLQQILFFKELDFPLDEIKRILDQDINLEEVLRAHKALLQKERRRVNMLIKTIDQTILHISGQTVMKDEDLYEGFSKEEMEEYKEEAKQKWGKDRVEESYKKVKSMSKEQWKKVQEEGGAIYQGFGELMGKKSPGDPEVQALVAKHYKHLHAFYTPNLEMYRGLGNLYVQDARFRAFYDKIKVGLADFIKDAIDHYCDNA